jgi:RNA polymerase sigma factor (sigma-70 family)
MATADHERRRRFDGLFEAYGTDIVAFCRWRAGSPADAQDAVSDVFLAAWRRLDDVPEGDAARIWLYGTARRVLANQRRSSRRRDALRERLTHETVEHVRPSPEDVEAEAELVREALRSLGSGDREVLLLAEWEGLSAAEIASVLGCLTVTARGRLHRARARFRAAFEELRAREGGPADVARSHPAGARPATVHVREGGS